MSKKPRASETPEGKAIVEALRALLTACINEHVKEQRRGKDNLRVISASELASHPIKGEQESYVDQILGIAPFGGHGPVGGACRYAIRLIGKRVYELFGSEGMEDIADRVLGRGNAHWRWQMRADILAKRWDGIGKWHS